MDAIEPGIKKQIQDEVDLIVADLVGRASYYIERQLREKWAFKLQGQLEQALDMGCLELNLTINFKGDRGNGGKE